MSDDEPAPAPAPASAPAATTATATSLPAPPTPEKEDGAVHAPAAPPPPATTSTSTAEGEGEDTAVMEAMELHLLTIKECFVYAVPRLATATGYRADDWGLANPLVTGSSLRCYRKGDDRLFLRIYASPPPASSDSNAGGSGKGGGLGDRPPTPRLFAEAPIYLGKGPRGEPPAPLEASFMPVTDSSRYFVLKVM